MKEQKDSQLIHSASDQSGETFNKFISGCRFVISAFKGKEPLSSLVIPGSICYFIFLGIIDFNILSRIYLGFLNKTACVLGLMFFVWHLIAVRRCSPKTIKLSKEEEKQLKIQQNQQRVQKLIHKLMLKEAIFNIQTNTFLTVIDFYFIVSCLQKIFF